MRPLGRIAAAIALVALVVGVGFWWLSRDTKESGPDWSAVPAVEPVIPAAAPVPPAAEIAEALAGVDVCDLLQGVPGARPVPAGDPGECWVRGADQAVYRARLARSGATRSAESLRGLERVDVGGFAAWRSPNVDPTRECTVVVPIGTDAWISLSGATNEGCDLLLAQARRVIAAFDPQVRAGLYAYDAETDLTGTAGCRRLLLQADRACAPAVERSVPSDPVQFLRRGEADPDVVCAAALAVAREHDPEMVAVTARTTGADAGTRECVLLDATGAVEVEVRASRDALGADPQGEVAGHQAQQGSDGTRWDVALGAPADRGTLTVVLGGAKDWPSYQDFVEDLVRAVL